MSKLILILGMVISFLAYAGDPCEGQPNVSPNSWNIIVNLDDKTSKENLITIIDMIGNGMGFNLVGVVPYGWPGEKIPKRMWSFEFKESDLNWNKDEIKSYKDKTLERLQKIPGTKLECVHVYGK